MSDFSAIGLNISSEEQFIEFANAQSSLHPRAATPVGGSYVKAAGRDGAELWIQLDPNGATAGAHPHFSGESRFSVLITRPRRVTNGSPLDGMLDCGMLDGQEGVPVIVDVPDFYMHAAWATPGARAVLQVAAFPRHVEVFASETEFSASPLGKLSAGGAYIPSGTFKPGGERIEPPTSEAIIVGRVVKAERRENELTKVTYYSALVETLGGSMDLVLDTKSVESVPVTGNIVSGTVALSARLVEPLFQPPKAAAARGASPTPPGQPMTAPKRSLLGRLFGRG
jgi:hypothetical protein